MRSLDEILLPTDFSPRAAEVARYAACLAGHFHSRLTLLHVLPPLDPAWLRDSAAVEEVSAQRKEEALNLLDFPLAGERGDEQRPGIAVQRILLEGDPAQMIAEYAARERVGFIMMPTRGCGMFRRFILGSVAAKVLHDVGCPVWTSVHVPDGPGASADPKVIVCATDLTAEGGAVLQWASDLAAELQARLIVVHGIPSLEFHPETYYLEADMRRALMGDARSKIAKALQNSPTPDAEVRVEGGNVSTTVRAVVEDNRADLLVIGRSSGSGMLGRLRTHSYALIRDSACPVISI